MQPVASLKWLLTPKNRDTLVQTFQAAEQLLRHEKDERVLQRSLYHYTRLFIDLGLIEEKLGAAVLGRVERTDAEEALRSAIHRLNCDLMRLLSGLQPCEHGCCCRCMQAYDNIACNLWFTHPTIMLALN